MKSPYGALFLCKERIKNMWISKNKYKELEKRIADLEQNQSQRFDVKLDIPDGYTYDLIKENVQMRHVNSDTGCCD